MQDRIALRVNAVTKHYPGVRALSDLSMEIRAGEVRALLGKNGAGKSTAIKVLSGAIRPDAGTIEVAGRAVIFSGPLAALDQGIATVYQEISLIPALSVAENIFLGRWRRGGGPARLVDHRRTRADAVAILDRLRIAVDPDIPVHRLNVAQQQLVEIAKAVSHDPKVLILDEPTSALPAHQVELLHDVVRRLAAAGTAILYVTHRLHEVPRIAHSVTVLRDGLLVATIPVAEATPARITELMVGESWVGTGFARHAPDGPVALSVEGLSTATGLKDITFELRAGEVLGLAGLLSSGRTELLRAIFGLDPLASGRIEVGGRPVPRPTPSLMKALGVALTAEDRKKDGLILPFPVETNATLAPVDRISRRGWLDRAAIRRLATGTVEGLGVKAPGLGAAVGTLSGGNQQKIVIGNWLNTAPRVLLMDEPSRGIDVAAKEQIFRLVRSLAEGGMAVLFVSSEIEEVLDVCDRILVLHEGRIVSSHRHDDLSLGDLMARTMNA